MGSQRARVSRLDGRHDFAHRQRHAAETNLVGEQQRFLLDRERHTISDHRGSVARAAIGQHQRAVRAQPNFRVNAADGVVCNGHIATFVAANGEGSHASPQRAERTLYPTLEIWPLKIWRREKRGVEWDGPAFVCEGGRDFQKVAGVERHFVSDRKGQTRCIDAADRRGRLVRELGHTA